MSKGVDGVIATYVVLGEEGTAWAWHLGDGPSTTLRTSLGSVRQLGDGDGDVTLAQGYTPFGVLLWREGSGASGYGYTGEREDASFDMLFLRARWYDVRTGRFVSQDPWSGSIYQPGTLHKYAYVRNNPVNLVDPTGLYHRYVHDDLTRVWARGIAGFQGISDPERMADHIAEGNWHVDDYGPLNSVGCNSCHFCSYVSTTRHVWDAIETGNPFIFGAALHQLQDFYSHRNEGFQFSHLLESRRAGVKPGQTSHRPQRLLDDFFKGWHDTPFGPKQSPHDAHPRDKVIRELHHRNGGLDFNGLSDDALIDLYLRREPDTDPDWKQHVRERTHFGIDPDRYVEGSWRDESMGEITRHYIGQFVLHIVADPCALDWTTPDDDESINDRIRQLLTSE